MDMQRDEHQIAIKLPNGQEYILDTNVFLKMDSSDLPEINYIKANTCFALQKFQEALLHSRQAFNELLKMDVSNSSEEFNYKIELLTRCAVIQANSYMNLNMPQKAIECTLENLASLDKSCGNFPNKLVLLVSLVDYNMCFLSSLGLNKDVKDFTNELIQNLVSNIKELKIDENFSYENLRVVCDLFHQRTIYMLNDDKEVDEFKLSICKEVIKECNNKLTRRDDVQGVICKFLDSMINVIDFNLAKVTSNEKYVEDALLEAMEKGDPALIGECMLMVDTIYRDNDKWYKILDTLDEPYFYLLEKIKDMKGDNLELCIAVKQFIMITISFANYNRINTEDYQMALKYMLTLQNVLESKNVSEVFGVDFSKIDNEDTLREVCQNYDDLIYPYILTYARTIGDFLESKNKLNFDPTKIMKIYSSYLKLYKDKDVLTYLALKVSEIDTYIYLKKKRLVKKGFKEITPLIKNELKGINKNDPAKHEELRRLKIKYLGTKLSYKIQFLSLDEKLNEGKIDSLFNKIRKLCTQKDNDFRAYALGLYIPIMIIRGENLYALKLCDEFSDIIKQQNNTKNKIYLVALRFRRDIYRNLNYREEYRQVKKEIRELKKLLEG